MLSKHIINEIRKTVSIFYFHQIVKGQSSYIFVVIFYLAIPKIEFKLKTSLTDHVAFSNGFGQQKYGTGNIRIRIVIK